MPLDYLSLVARRTVFLYRTIIIAKIVLGRLLYTVHYTDSRLKHIPSLSVKKGLSTCPGTPTQRTGFRFATHIEATEAPSGNTGRKI